MKIEIVRMLNILNLDRNYLQEVRDLCNFIRNCAVPYTKCRVLSQIVPTGIFIWLRHHNYLISRQEFVEYTSLTHKEFKRFLVDIYDVVPFEGIIDEVIEIHMEKLLKASKLVSKIEQLSRDL